jgi:transposase-like protein
MKKPDSYEAVFHSLAELHCRIQSSWLPEKVTKSKGAFPNLQSACRLLFLAHREVLKKWTMPIPHWPLILSQLVIGFENRLPL